MSRDDSPLRAERAARLVEIDGEQAEIAYDPDGETWYIRASSVPGLAAQDADLDALLAELPMLIRSARLP